MTVVDIIQVSSNATFCSLTTFLTTRVVAKF